MDFPEYWTLFVRAHASSALRRLHFTTMTAGLGCLAVGLVSRRMSWLLAALGLTVVPAWIARRLDGAPELPWEPVHAVAANVKMWHLTRIGEMDAEVARIIAQAVEESFEDMDESVPPPNMVTDHTLH